MAPVERDDFLAEQSSDDLSIADEVRSMLAGVPPSEFLNAPSNLPPEESYSGGGLEGLKMGEFELIEEIGHGGMGVVYRAHQPGLERDVAVKILPKIRTGDEQALERFRREAKAASNLNHPNVVPILSVGESHGMAWYAMTLIEGQDLGAFIHDLKSGSSKAEAVFGKFGTDDYFRNLAAAFAQVCDAVHYAHQSGVIHRDIKPANILLDPNGKLLLTDFGLAKDERFGSMSVSGQLQGTPHYMSPEQARASVNKIDHRTDIYSLSVVLYELLSLKRPFGGDSALEVLDQILKQQVRPLHSSAFGVPMPLSILAEKGMDKDAHGRFGEVSDLATDLRRYSRGEAIHTLGPTRLTRVIESIRRNQRGLRKVGFVVVTGVALGIGLPLWMRYAQMIPVIIEDTGDGWEAEVYEHNWELGTLSFLGTRESNFRLSEGDYRIVVRLGDQYSEFTRYIRTGSAPVRLAPRLGAFEDKGMIKIEKFEVQDLGFDEINDFQWSGYASKDISVNDIWVDIAEVSNADYWEYLKAQPGAEVPLHWDDPASPFVLQQVLTWSEIPRHAEDWGRLPVIGLTQSAAQQYAEWSGKRLPTSWEWMAIARGEKDRQFPWQEKMSDLPKDVVVGFESNDRTTPWPGYWDYVRLADEPPVWDVQPDFGIWNMYGNVSEWTESPLIKVEHKGEQPKPQLSNFIAMGECWLSGSENPREIGELAPLSPSVRWVGFRCVKGTYLDK